MKQNIREELLPFPLSFLFLMIFFSCTEETPDRVILSVADESAEQFATQALAEVSPILVEDLEVTLWASEELISDPVALDVDPFGRVWVTITERRRNAELDIRGHNDWMIESVTFETTEDKRAFVHRKLAPERSDENTWLTDHNEDGIHDWQDLTVNKESIFRIEDLTGNGYANQAELFIRDFHDDITDVAGAILYHEGDVFLGVSPDLWRIRDTTGDGYGDEKESVSHGYGVHIGFAGHGMSGLTTGPDGRIYWSIGDVGMSVTDRNGKRWHYPHQGIIVRSEPDGSNFEVFAAGLRNTHEFVFDKYGNLITVDNDGDHAGEHERLIYVVNGSDSGWRLNWQFGKYNDPKNNDYKVLMEEGYFRTRFEEQAAHLLPPLGQYHSGPAGMAYNPGTALNEQWKDHFFIAKFVGSAANSGIHAFTLKEKGASFELEQDEQIMGGILATGLDFGPDGALYFADWIEGWTLKQKGRIWKMDTPAAVRAAIRSETKNLLAEDFTNQTSEELLGLLKHEDMRVRKKAQFKLAERDDTDTFLEALDQKDHQLARIHSIWGLAQIARRTPEVIEPLISYLDDADPEIRAQAAKMLGDVRYKPAAESLIPLLEDENARVRFFATEALGRMSWRPAVDPVIKMLEANNDEDVYLRHGGAIALERIGDAVALSQLAEHPSRAVRIAAVVALNRLESPEVVRFLKDDDEFIVTNAARAINDDTMIEEGIDDLAMMLDQSRFTNEPLIRRAINANLYHGTQDDARRLVSFAARDEMPAGLRAEALKTLSVWPEPSVLDRVTGDPRGELNNNPDDARGAFAAVFTDLLSEDISLLKIAAVKTAGSLNFRPAIPDISNLLYEDPSPDVRIASLQTLVDMKYEEIEKAVFAALEDENQKVRMNALRVIPELNLQAENVVALIKMVLEDATTEEYQEALSILGNMNHPSSYDVLESQMELLIRGDLAREAELDVIMAVETAGSDPLVEMLRAYQSEKSGEDSVSVYSESLYGGQADEGRRIFYQNAAAQCIRCHAAGSEGSEVGPELTSVGERLSREEILRSMVDPNARLSPGYGSVTLTLNNGDTVRGMLSAETDTHITVSGRNQEWIIQKNDIAERVNSPSGMPAMGSLLTRSELRNLVEFLTTLQGDED